jgi:beta-glucosidase
MAGDSVEIFLEPGCTSHKTTPTLGPELLAGKLSVEYWNGHDRRRPARVRDAHEASFTWFGAFAPEIDRAPSARASAGARPRSPARTSSLVSAGQARLFVDGVQVIDNWTAQTPGEAFFGLGSSEVRAEVQLEGGRRYDLAVEFANLNRPMLGGLKVGCLRAPPADLLERAVSRAASCDAAIVVIGLNDEWESEGHDRTTLALAGRQAELLERVAAANPRTIAVVNRARRSSSTGSSACPRAPALVRRLETANALSDVLFGDVNPSGRLPQSWPRRLEDTPAFLNWPGGHGRVEYGEGLFIGYRWYDARKLEPALPFGHGLSYTRFAYTDLRLSKPSLRAGESLEVTLELENRGARAGQEVVQLYLRDVASRVQRPEKELRAFAKVELAPGERRELRFTLAPRAFAAWDPGAGDWVAEPGEFEILVGASSREICARAAVLLEPA